MMEIEVTVKASSPEDLHQKLKVLSANLGNDVITYEVRRGVRLTRRDVDGLLDEWCEVCAGGNYMRRHELIQKHANEVTLYDAPIDTWWAIAKDAQEQIRLRENLDRLDAMLEGISK